jgi:hypothetical protein
MAPERPTRRQRKAGSAPLTANNRYRPSNPVRSETKAESACLGLAAACQFIFAT